PGPHTFAVAVSPNSSSNTQRYSNTVRALNTWYYVTGVYDATAGTLNIYVNGVLDNGVLSGTVPPSQYNAPANVNVGQRGGGYLFQGRIDEVRIYSRALSPAAIQTDMNTAIAAVPDTQPPSVPTGLAAQGVSPNQINLSWNPSNDNIGVKNYVLERCDGGATCTSAFTQIATPTATSYNDTGLAAATSYGYRAPAVDAAGNTSASPCTAATTTPAPCSRPPSPPVTDSGGTTAAIATTPAAPSSLLAAYAFSEGSGTTTADASGKGHTGTLSGATWTNAGKYGQALSFNGSTSYVDLGNAADLQLTGSMTVSAWIFATANPPDDGQIVSKSTGAGWQFKTSPDTGPHTFAVAVSPNSSSNTQRYSNTVRALNTWYYVTGVYDATAGTLNIYVNGVLDNGVLSGTVPPSQYNAPANVNVGQRGGGYLFQGTIDEVRIYNRALSPAEIQSDMNTAIGGP